jgi:hypothetical protein
MGDRETVCECQVAETLWANQPFHHELQSFFSLSSRHPTGEPLFISEHVHAGAAFDAKMTDSLAITPLALRLARPSYGIPMDGEAMTMKSNASR